MNENEKSMSIIELEASIVANDFNESERILKHLIIIYSEHKVDLVVAPFNRILTKEQQELESYQIIEKLAVLVTAWFSNKNYLPSKKFYAFLCLQKQFLSNLFAASSYHSTDHILTNLGLMGKTEFSPLELEKLLFIITIETTLEVPWDVMFKHLPDPSVLAYSGLLRSINIQMSQRAKNNIQRLIKAASTAPVVTSANPNDLSPLISTYFNCSNLADPNKYEIKKWIVRCIEKFMDGYLNPDLKKRIKSEVKTKPDKNKTKMLIIHERYTEGHAMYRCWHSSFKSFLSSFDVTAIGLSAWTDQVAHNDAHTFITIKEAIDIVGFIEAILRVKPDIIIYPSIGMSIFSPLIATLRLAPIQIACGGHPSSSYIDTIDYMLWEDFVPSQVMDKILTEKFLPYKSEFSQVKMLPYSLNLLPKNNKTKIVLNGVIQKITAELIDICKQIIEKSDKELEFHVFMAHPKQNIEYFSSMSILRRFLPNCIVHSFTNYDNYMNIVGNCDFALPTIPFGGSNSNIDLIRLKIPKLFVKNESDLCSLTDYQIWKSIDVLDGYCESVDELISKALKWISAPNLLEPIKEKLNSNKVSNLLLKCQKTNDVDFRVSDVIQSILK